MTIKTNTKKRRYEIDDEISKDEEQEWDMEMLVYGAEDGKYLDSLSELERESILDERFEKLKREVGMKKAIREK
jgi:hypothetical protein